MVLRRSVLFHTTSSVSEYRSQIDMYRTGRCENINSMYSVYYLSRKGVYHHQSRSSRFQILAQKIQGALLPNTNPTISLIFCPLLMVPKVYSVESPCSNTITSTSIHIRNIAWNNAIGNGIYTTHILAFIHIIQYPPMFQPIRLIMLLR
jgi:hypothetical protein